MGIEEEMQAKGIDSIVKEITAANSLHFEKECYPDMRDFSDTRDQKRTSPQYS
jgi:hypothetical protein